MLKKCLTWKYPDKFKDVVLYTLIALATNEKTLKTKIFSLIFLIFLSSTWTQSTLAVVVEQMYEVSLPVVSQEKDIRQAAFEQAFIEVLVRISGNSAIAAQLDIKQARNYIQQYRYLALDKPIVQEETANTIDIPVAKHKLWIQFNEGLIKKLLRDNAMPVWGKQRPTVLVWLAVRDGNNRYILRQQDRSVLKEALSKEAQRRGLPVEWPKFDAQDRQKVLFADVWGSFWDPVIAASQRYNVDAVLIGQMNWLSGSWQVNWSMKLADKTQSWRLRALDLDVLMASGIDLATDQIAQQFAVLEDDSSEGEIIVQVNNVKHVYSYAKTQQYLSSLAPVKNVFATRIEPDHVRFSIDMTGDQEDLERIIALGKTLLPDKQKEKPVNLENGQLPVKLPIENILTYKFNQ